MKGAPQGVAAATAAPGRRSRLEYLAMGAWLLLLLGIPLRLLLEPDPQRNNVYLKVFAPAAAAFVDGRPLYGEASGFRYPPLMAALLVPFGLAGPVLGSVLWRLLNLLALALGVGAALQRGFPRPLAGPERGLFLLLLAVAVSVSLNNGQPNVLILGCSLLATTSVLAGRNAAAAAAVAAGAACKVYPLAYGLVLGALRPRLLASLLPLLLLVAGLPLLLQEPAYVLEQYRSLASTLAAEERSGDLTRAYRDLRLLFAAAGCPLPALLFHLLQVLGGAAIVAACWLSRRSGAASARVLEYAFSLTMCYFMLLGPATEKSTYALLGPTLAWPLLSALAERRWPALWLWGAANLLLVLGQVERASRATQAAEPWLRCLLPAAALLAAIGLVLRLRRDLRQGPGGSRSWQEGGGAG